VIEQYRERLPVTGATPVVTLQGGGTPLAPAEYLSSVSTKYFCTVSQPGLRLSTCARRPAAGTRAPGTVIATLICTAPRATLCTATELLAGSTNCGSSDSYSTAIFGLSRLVSRPVVNSRHGG
jgi:hypothetical protein